MKSVSQDMLFKAVHYSATVAPRFLELHKRAHQVALGPSHNCLTFIQLLALFRRISAMALLAAALALSTQEIIAMYALAFTRVKFIAVLRSVHLQRELRLAVWWLSDLLARRIPRPQGMLSQ